MRAEEIRRSLIVRPFQPFTLHSAGGRHVAVTNPDFALVSPTGRLVDVFQADDSHDILDIVLITGIEFGPPPAAPTPPPTNGQG